MKSFFRIIRVARPYSSYAFLNVFFNIWSVLFSLVSLAMIIPFLQLLFSDDIGASTAIPPLPSFRFSVQWVVDVFNHYFIKLIVNEGKLTALLAICLLVITVFFFKNLTRYLALYFMAPLRHGVVRDLRQQVFEKVVNLPVSFFSDRKKGDIMARMTSDLQEIERFIMSTLEVVVKEPVTILVYLGAMIFMSPQLTVFVLAMLLLTALLIGRIGKTLKQTSQRGQERLGELMSIIDETLTGLRIVKAFNAQRYQLRRFQQENDRHFTLMKKMFRRKELSSPLSEFLGISIVVLVLWFGGKLVLGNEGHLSAEAFIGFMLIFSQLIPPAKSFSTAFYNIQKGLASSDRIFQMLGEQPETVNYSGKRPVKGFHDRITYENVSFAYDSIPVLEDINLEIKKGETVAIVGQSGAGKSTLVDLLPGFYPGFKGRICIDGVDIRDIRLEDLRGLIGIVTQESILFHDTVFNNIAFGMENVREEDVIHAAKLANAHDFIMRLPGGYHTVIGDRGSKLSGGERQRITIARALLKNPPILILDEATSNLDSESEKLVQDAIMRLMASRTSIVIAHRLSTIQHADKIFVLENGRIIESGDHHALIARNGTYKKLIELQAI